MSLYSQNALRRQKWRFGRVYSYRPYKNLVQRLAKELKLSEDEIQEQIQKERAWLIGNPWYR
jgi:energy-converting hydrogenase A subunit M